MLSLKWSRSSFFIWINLSCICTENSLAVRCATRDGATSSCIWIQEPSLLSKPAYGDTQWFIVLAWYYSFRAYWSNLIWLGLWQTRNNSSWVVQNQIKVDSECTLTLYRKWVGLIQSCSWFCSLNWKVSQIDLFPKIHCLFKKYDVHMLVLVIFKCLNTENDNWEKNKVLKIHS